MFDILDLIGKQVRFGRRSGKVVRTSESYIFVKDKSNKYFKIAKPKVEFLVTGVVTKEKSFISRLED